MRLEEAKNNLIEILTAWENEEIDGWDVQGEAESIEDSLVNSGLLKPQKETGGLAAQIDSALNQLTNAELQATLPEDIPTILTMLDAKEPNISNALLFYSEYWNGIDYSKRELALKKYWYGTNT
jgi:hypothetical protein